MKEHQRGGPRHHGLLENLARVNEARGEAAHGDDGLVLETPPHVEGQQAEGLDGTGRVARDEIGGGLGGRPEGRRLCPGLAADANGKLEGGEHARGLGAAEPVRRFELPQ